MVLGWNAAGKPVDLSADMRRSTHMHVIGGSGTGKSRFLEWMIGRDLRDGRRLCLIDWHGTLYNDVLRCCAYQGVGTSVYFRSLVLLNPSQPDFITGFNPFVAGEGDVSVQVSRRVRTRSSGCGRETHTVPIGHMTSQLSHRAYYYRVNSTATFSALLLSGHGSRVSPRRTALQHVRKCAAQVSQAEGPVSRGVIETA